MDGTFSFDPSLLDIPYHGRRHARSSSKASSVYSAVSTAESTPDSVCTRLTTPPRASPPVRHHGPLLLPKIRSQDQDIDLSRVSAAAAAGLCRARKTHSAPPPAAAERPLRASHARSYTNPETLSGMAYAHMSSFTGRSMEDRRAVSGADAAPLLCSPVSFAHDGFSAEPEMMFPDGLPSRRASTCGSLAVDKFGYPTYRQMPFVSASTAPSTQSDFAYAAYAPRAPSPLSLASPPGETPSVAVSAPSTTLINFLTAPNPAASLVRSISFPLRDPGAKHFWWDVRSVRAWTSFSAAAVLALPGAAALLTTPVPAPALPRPAMPSRHPETEAALHAIYAAYYLPKLNAALAISSGRPLQLSVPARAARAGPSSSDLLFVANAAGESSTAAAMFGGKPSARVVGLVRSFDRFNTGMRVEGNIKRVEYLRGLAALHHAMREHGCRYGFILTEIELVVVRNGADPTPYFGDLDITSVQLAVSGPEGDAVSSTCSSSSSADDSPSPMTACLAFWGLCQLAGDAAAAAAGSTAHAPWRAEIGAPAEGTRRKARPRDNWMPQPQLAEKREAKRSRGWVWPEDPIGRKELGKRGVKYGGV